MFNDINFINLDIINIYSLDLKSKETLIENNFDSLKSFKFIKVKEL